MSLPELIHRCSIILVYVLGGDDVIDITNTIESRQQRPPHGILVDLSTTPFQLSKKLAQRMRVVCAVARSNLPALAHKKKGTAILSIQSTM